MQSNGTLIDSGPSASPEGRESMGLWLIIRPHRWRIAAGLALGLAMAILFHQLTGPWNESSAELMVIKKQLETAPISLPANYHVQDDYLPTHMVMIASPKVVKQAVVRNDLGSLESFHKKNSAQAFIDSTSRWIFGEKPKGPPEDGVTKAVIGSLVADIPKLGVTPSHEILGISCRARNPEDCRTVLNAVIASYQDFLKDTYRDLNRETLEMITKAAEMLQKELEAKEAEYLEFRQKTPPLWRGKDGNTVHQDRLFNIDSRLIALQMRQKEIMSSLEAVEEGLRKGRSSAELLALLPGLPSNREILAPSLLPPDPDPSGTGRSARVTFAEQLILLQLQDNKLSQEFGPRHPDVQKIRQQLQALRMLTPSSSPAMDSGDGKAKDPNFVQTMIQMLKMELAGNQRAEKKLTELFDHDQQEAKAATINELKDDAYRQGIERRKILYESIVGRLKEITSAQDHGGYTTQVLSPPQLGKLFLKKYAIVLGACLFGGMVIGIGWSYLVHISDKRFRTPQEIHKSLGLPVLGHIPRFAVSANGFHLGASNGTVGKSIMTSRLDSKSATEEAYRAVRTTAFFSSQAANRKIIQITSPNFGDGKSTLVANLAFSLAQVGKKVLLIDADLRSPSLHDYYRLPNNVGLSSLLVGDAEPDSAIHPTEIPGLSVLPSGPASSNPGELLTSPRLKELFEIIRNRFDFVLVDTPSPLSVADACVVAPLVDGVLLTLRIAKNGRPYAQQAWEQLKTMGAKGLGVVVNQGSYDAGTGSYR